MTFFGNIFPGGNSSKDKSPFEKWNSPPPMTSVPAGRQDVFPLRSLSVGSRSVSASLGPSIVIGLGDTGVLALQQWLEQTAHYENGSFDNVYVLSLSMAAQKPLPQRWINVRQISLSEGSADKNLSPLEIFRQAASIRQFQEWLKSALLSLRDVKSQVLIVASAAEREIHLLGPILQILRVFPESAISPYSNIVGLLSLASSKLGSDISQDERYAALREISRFTFSGLHKAMELPNLKESVVRSALLDHLFLFDDNLFPVQDESTFNSGLGQALSESLFFLNHPTSKEFWDKLKKDAAGQFRKIHHQPLAHTVGIKTFFVPLTEMQSYLATRLAYAVLFGERAQDAADQLIPAQSAAPMDGASVETLARRWLLDRGAGSHPVFEWLWNLKSSDQLVLSEISALYDDLYAFNISHKLASFFNEYADADKFKIAALVLRAHSLHFEKILSMLENSSSPYRDELARTLNHWKKVSEYLGKSIAEWQKVFTLSSGTSANSESLQQNTFLKIKAGSNLPPVTADRTIGDLLRGAQKDAEKNLVQVLGGKARFALTHNALAPLTEVEEYYKDTIRPEIGHLGMTAGAGFKWVRNRLTWWIRLESSRMPELLLICWPSAVTIEGEAKPLPEHCYFYEDRQKIVEAVISLAKTQISGLIEDLTGAWYTRRLEDTIAPLRGKTEEVFLSYDEDIASKYDADADRRYYYLVGKNKEVTGRFIKIKAAFPYRTSAEVNELEGNDLTRFTALTARLNIPFAAIREINKWSEAYSHQSHLHQYTQERLAAIYEDLMIRRFGKTIMLSPDFILTLADEQLTTLFCQSLFCKLISVENNEIKRVPFWQVGALGKNSALDLAPVSSDGLLDAFRAFTLELPNDPSLNLNPTKHFYSDNRENFLNALLKEGRSIRHSPKFKSLQIEFKNGILADWQARNDLLSHSFAAVLQIELEEPVWQGWF